MSPPFFSPAQNGAPRLRLDVWEKGNISIVQLEEKLRGAARQALADAIMELRLLPASLCTEDTSPGTCGPENVPGPGSTLFPVRLQRWVAEAPSEVHIQLSFIFSASARRHASRSAHVQLVPHVERDTSSGTPFTQTRSSQSHTPTLTNRWNKGQVALIPVSGLDGLK